MPRSRVGHRDVQADVATGRLGGPIWNSGKCLSPCPAAHVGEPSFTMELARDARSPNSAVIVQYPVSPFVPLVLRPHKA